MVLIYVTGATVLQPCYTITEIVWNISRRSILPENCAHFMHVHDRKVQNETFQQARQKTSALLKQCLVNFTLLALFIQVFSHIRRSLYDVGANRFSCMTYPPKVQASNTGILVIKSRPLLLKWWYIHDLCHGTTMVVFNRCAITVFSSKTFMTLVCHLYVRVYPSLRSLTSANFGNKTPHRWCHWVRSISFIWEELPKGFGNLI